MTHIREPAVAGYFYTGNARELMREVRKYMGRAESLYGDAVGILSPHAGYMYSGLAAGKVVGSVEVPERVIILGPNHTGLGKPVAVYPEGKWLFPGFEVEVDSELSQAIVEEWPGAVFDEMAHLKEHSLEVQVPFLYAKNPHLKIAAVCLGVHSPEDVAEGGEALARAIKRMSGKVLIVASSDMTHYEPDDVARKKDAMAIDRMKKLDEMGLLEVTEKFDISMCGVIPAGVAIRASRKLGAKEGVLVEYRTSADAGAGKAQVVGYAGMVFR